MIIFVGGIVLTRTGTALEEPPTVPTEVPANALLDDQGQPILDDQGNFIIVNI